MGIQARIKSAMSRGDFYGKIADAAAASGFHLKSAEYNRKAAAAYTEAETLEIEAEGEES